MKQGVTRLVFLIGRYAIKIPNFKYSTQNFLSGCLANHNERLFCKQYKGMPQLTKVAYTYYSSIFGLINIQKRASPVLDNVKQGYIDKAYFKDVCNDFKFENFGIIGGRLVCVDYG